MDNNINKYKKSVDDAEEVIDESLLNFSSLEELNPKIFNVIKKIEIPEMPDSVENQIMAEYRRHYRYRILWRTIKTKIRKYKEDLFGTRGGLEVALASIAALFILSIVAFYYINPQNNPPKIISNQKTPIIKVSPNPTRPIPTSSPIQNINPDIVKSPENNSDGIRRDNTKENDKQVERNKNTKPSKPEESKDLYKEDNNIAVNNIKRDKRTNSSPKTNNTTNIIEKSLTLSNLVYVAVMDLKIKDQEPDPIDEEIKQELIKAINSSGKWQLSSVKDAEAIFKKQNNDSALVLFDKKTTNILWKSVDYINNYKNNKDYIKITVETLSNYQKQ